MLYLITGHLCGEFIDHRWISSQRPVTRSFDVFFDLRLNKRLSRQSRRWWFETPSRSLWRHCNVYEKYRPCSVSIDYFFLSVNCNTYMFVQICACIDLTILHVISPHGSFYFPVVFLWSNIKWQYNASYIDTCINSRIAQQMINMKINIYRSTIGYIYYIYIFKCHCGCNLGESINFRWINVNPISAAHSLMRQREIG